MHLLSQAIFACDEMVHWSKSLGNTSKCSIDLCTSV